MNVSSNDKGAVVQYTSFEQFYPFYLSQHRHPVCRILHFVGTHLALFTLLYLLYNGSFAYFWLALIPGYGCAWVGHFFFEQNKPATFKYPLYSFIGDWCMMKDLYLGRVPFNEGTWKAPKLRGPNYEK